MPKEDDRIIDEIIEYLEKLVRWLSVVKVNPEEQNGKDKWLQDTKEALKKFKQEKAGNTP